MLFILCTYFVKRFEAIRIKRYINLLLLLLLLWNSLCVANIELCIMSFFITETSPHALVRAKCAKNMTRAREKMVQQTNRKRKTSTFVIGDNVTIKVNKTGKAGRRQDRKFGTITSTTPSGLYRIHMPDRAAFKGPVDASSLLPYPGNVKKLTGKCW